MYIYILLSLCASATAVSFNLWNLFEQILSTTHSAIVPEDARLNISQLASKYGYPLEEHTVTTKDGYIINLHRIVKSTKQNAPVVFLMHGILESSDSWVLLGPGQAFAYLLADYGFDVWMGNTRGNKHAFKHTSLSNKDAKFWEFTWEEIALNDLPAMIDYVLELTKQHGLYYIGHSQGTTIGYVLCSMKPEYNMKIKTMFSLAPEAWMGNVKSPIVRMLSPSHDTLGLMLQDYLNTGTSGLDFFNKISSFVCSIIPGKCDNILFALSGFETKVNNTFLSVILGHSPTGASTLQFVHYGQLVLSHRFARFDFGPGMNIIKYRQETPPDYDLSRVVTPVVLFYSGQDWLSDPQDVDELRKHLPNVILYVYLEDFTHIDYVYASDAVPIVYNKIIAMILEAEQLAPNMDPQEHVNNNGQKDTQDYYSDEYYDNSEEQPEEMLRYVKNLTSYTVLNKPKA